MTSIFHRPHHDLLHQLLHRPVGGKGGAIMADTIRTAGHGHAQDISQRLPFAITGDKAAQKAVTGTYGGFDLHTGAFDQIFAAFATIEQTLAAQRH